MADLAQIHPVGVTRGVILHGGEALVSTIDLSINEETISVHPELVEGPKGFDRLSPNTVMIYAILNKSRYRQVLSVLATASLFELERQQCSGGPCAEIDDLRSGDDTAVIGSCLNKNETHER